MTSNDRDTHGRKHDDARQTRPQPKSSDFGQRAVDAIEGNPLGILVGGLAVGALAGALLPRSEKEKELLAPVGRQLSERARAAAAAAREAGKAELAGLGISKDAARTQAKSLLDGVTKAVTSAGSAAAKEVAAKSAV